MKIRNLSKRIFALSAGCLLFAITIVAQTTAPAPAPAPDFQQVIARQASLISEFDVNGLKVLVKKREGSQTVAAGLFIRGGVENITAVNAGVEALRDPLIISPKRNHV